MGRRRAAEVVATTTFVTWHVDDEDRPVEVTVSEGDRLEAGHPIVAAQAQFFRPVPPKRTAKAK
jgi:hypothetical protein